MNGALTSSVIALQCNLPDVSLTHSYIWTSSRRILGSTSDNIIGGVIRYDGAASFAGSSALSYYQRPALYL